MRPALYEPSRLAAADDSYFAQMRRHFIEQATTRGYALIDMQPVFERDYAKNGTRFEFKEDAHWNAAAHGLAAERIAGARMFQELFGSAVCQ
jgi:hypothetical protein